MDQCVELEKAQKLDCRSSLETTTGNFIPATKPVPPTHSNYNFLPSGQTRAIHTAAMGLDEINSAWRKAGAGDMAGSASACTAVALCSYPQQKQTEASVMSVMATEVFQRQIGLT